jgi:hypothetical protein
MTIGVELVVRIEMRLNPYRVIVHLETTSKIGGKI